MTQERLGLVVVLGLVAAAAALVAVQRTQSDEQQSQQRTAALATRLDKLRETPSRARPPAAPASRINLANYEALRAGMSEREVRALLGDQPRMLLQAKDANHTTHALEWSDKPGKFIHVQFVDNQVVAMTMVGL